MPHNYLFIDLLCLFKNVLVIILRLCIVYCDPDIATPSPPVEYLDYIFFE